jgi:hypothetical protein
VCAFIFYSDPVAASEAYVVEGPWIFDGSYWSLSDYEGFKGWQ